jgi:hypothetical protein
MMKFEIISPQMLSTLKIMCRKKSLVGLLIANLVVFVPFVFWMSISPLLPPDHLMSIPRVLSYELLFRSLSFGFLLCFVGSLFIGIPTIYHLTLNEEIKRSQFAKETVLVTMLASAFFGFLLCVSMGAAAVFPLAAFLIFITLIVPSIIATTVYWFIAIREPKEKVSLITFSILFLFYNFLCSNFAALAATD